MFVAYFTNIILSRFFFIYKSIYARLYLLISQHEKIFICLWIFADYIEQEH